MTRRLRAIVALLACAACGCRGGHVPHEVALEARADLLVVAPHPDDEVLMAGALIGEARARGQRVVVAIVTNGDARCNTAAVVRDRESLEALARLGVPRADVLFLGYPDGGLEGLGERPLALRPRVDDRGRCTEATGTYVGKIDNIHTVSMQRLGVESPYGEAALRDDLAWVLQRTRPKHIVTAHPADDHPDHAATGLFVARALERVAIPEPEVDWSVVHAGECWPTPEGDGCLSGAPNAGAPLEPLPGALATYTPDLRVPWRPGAGPGPAEVIGAYASQLGGDPATNWLQSFVRADQAFYRSTVRCEGEGDARRCTDPRFVRAQPSALPAGPWDSGAALVVPAGAGLRIADAPGRVRRVCFAPSGSGVVAFEAFDSGRVDGRPDATRRFDLQLRGELRLAWAPERGGVVSFELRDDRGAVGRRLAALTPPLRVSRDDTCARVP